MTPADVLDEAYIAHMRRNLQIADESQMIQLATIGSWGKEGQEQYGKALKRFRGEG